MLILKFSEELVEKTKTKTNWFRKVALFCKPKTKTKTRTKTKAKTFRRVIYKDKDMAQIGFAKLLCFATVQPCR